MKKIFVCNEEELNNEFIGIFCKIGRRHHEQKSIEEISDELDYPVISLINEPDVVYHNFEINIVNDYVDEFGTIYTNFEIEFLKTNVKLHEERIIKTYFTFHTYRNGDKPCSSILEIQNGIFDILMYAYTPNEDGTFNIKREYRHKNHYEIMASFEK